MLSACCLLALPPSRIVSGPRAPERIGPRATWHVRHAPRRLAYAEAHADADAAMAAALDVAQHVSLFGKFADVAVSCSSPSSPRRTLSLLYCDSCPRHSTTLRTRLTIAQGGGHCTGPPTSYLATFFRPCSQTALQGEAAGHDG